VKFTSPIDPATIPLFPVAECVSPEQVYALNTLGAERQAHLSTCPWCKNTVASAQSSNEQSMGRPKTVPEF
jgi:hypothetical protein